MGLTFDSAALFVRCIIHADIYRVASLIKVLKTSPTKRSNNVCIENPLNTIIFNVSDNII